VALLDRERSLIVVRVVYDGPPEAGKTTSLRALAGSLGRPLASPGERDGRTLFFDWMDYTGGRFEGCEIRCQIVSVPGQRELQERRRHLLREADVVVFVADTTERRLDHTMAMLAELPRLLAGVPAPPVGIILQANKRDCPDAVPLGEVRARTHEHGGSVGIIESVASDGTGIRETFVFAVRLALDRVREQLRAQTLPLGAPRTDDSDALLAELQLAEERPAPPPASAAAAAAVTEALVPSALRQVLAENDEEQQLSEFVPWHEPGAALVEDGGPRPPDAAAPSGAIWPPVEGRLILHEATAANMTVHRLRRGGWAAGIGNGWRAYSGGGAVYDDLEAGRETLIRWARLHVACSGILSPHRCIVLAATGQGSWRLWQIVRAERSLRDELDDIERCSTEEAAARLLDTATLLSEIGGGLQNAPCQVPCSLDTIGRGEHGSGLHRPSAHGEDEPAGARQRAGGRRAGVDLVQRALRTAARGAGGAGQGAAHRGGGTRRRRPARSHPTADGAPTCAHQLTSPPPSPSPASRMASLSGSVSRTRSSTSSPSSSSGERPEGRSRTAMSSSAPSRKMRATNWPRLWLRARKKSSQLAVGMPSMASKMSP
jgi:signal recognition particle receptor subunit beta